MKKYQKIRYCRKFKDELKNKINKNFEEKYWKKFQRVTKIENKSNNFEKNKNFEEQKYWKKFKELQTLKNEKKKTSSETKCESSRGIDGATDRVRNERRRKSAGRENDGREGRERRGRGGDARGRKRGDAGGREGDFAT